MEEEKVNQQPEETEAYPIDAKKETIHFPWSIAIIMGVLMLIIIVCFVVIMVLGPGDPVTSSSAIAGSSM